MATATKCPHCHQDLATGQTGRHCPPINDGTPNGRSHPTCTWIGHECGAVIDIRTGKHTHKDHPTRRELWPCNNGVH